MVDPLQRWKAAGLPDKPDYAGLLTFAGMVEVIPTAVGSADITALVAERVVREALTGIAVGRRRSQ